MNIPTASAAQQDYPDRSIRRLAINAADGRVDAMLSMLAARMAADTGQPVLVEIPGVRQAYPVSR